MLVLSIIRAVDKVLYSQRREIQSDKVKRNFLLLESVECLIFFFHSDSFASTGQDKKLRIWTLPKDPESENVKWKVDLKYEYYYVPHNLAFRPGSEILAVAEKYGLFFFTDLSWAC